MKISQLLEELAKLEHEQWIEWSKSLASKEKLSEERLKRWKEMWVPYENLAEEQKEQDRAYARKAMRLIGIKKMEANKTNKELKESIADFAILIWGMAMILIGWQTSILKDWLFWYPLGLLTLPAAKKGISLARILKRGNRVEPSPSE
jgi:hypothetical protein